MKVWTLTMDPGGEPVTTVHASHGDALAAVRVNLDPEGEWDHLADEDLLRLVDFGCWVLIEHHTINIDDKEN